MDLIGYMMFAVIWNTDDADETDLNGFDFLIIGE